ncbi:MAG: hypothetical protein LLG97_19395 [Deltaproteobacteria bacterium]|nr:hypothetical protein [Deltaproteobacteria bacterium]
MKRITTTCIFLIIVLSSSASLAGTYYVSATGAATWANCEDAAGTPGPKSGAAACSVYTANQNASAGDKVYVRGGTYTFTSAHGCGNDYWCGIQPKNKGTAGAKIEFSAYQSEVPVFTKDETASVNLAGVRIDKGTVDVPGTYIRVSGIQFQNMPVWIDIHNYSSYNEITGCKFWSDTGENFYSSAGVSINNGCNLAGADYDCFPTHNWIHDNIFSKVHQSQATYWSCVEGADMVRIGGGYSLLGHNQDATTHCDYNTFERNYLEYAGHAMLDTYGGKNVVKDNIMQNNAWIEDYLASVSITSIVGVSGTVTVTTDINHGLADYTMVAISGTTNFNGTYSVRSSGGNTNTFTFSKAGNIAEENSGSLGCTYPAMPNGKYSHRGIQISEDYGRPKQFVLVENNRIGWAGANPNNPGEGSLTIAGSGVIARYNNVYGGQQSGIIEKYVGYADGGTTTLAGDILAGATTIPVADMNDITSNSGFTLRINDSPYEFVTCTGRSGNNFTGCSGASAHLSGVTVYTNRMGRRGQGGSGPYAVRIYNNTAWWNGQTYPYMQSAQAGCATCPGKLGGITMYDAFLDAKAKNNIAYDNYSYTYQAANCPGGVGRDITVGSVDHCHDPADTADIFEVTNNWETRVVGSLGGDPKFVNPVKPGDAGWSDAYYGSQSLFSAEATYAANPLPDLRLQASSTAKNVGTYLTTVSSVTDQTHITLADPMYFQDGSWGSALATLYPDEICFSTSATVVGSNCIAIKKGTINYTTGAVELNSTPGSTVSVNDYVWLYKKSDGTQVAKGTAPDMGANEYDEESDATAPVVTAFTIPATATSLTVPITTFTATDAVGVTGYCLAETNDSAGCSWEGSAPASYTFGAYGSKTLYAFAKDAADNVSDSASDTVVITEPTFVGSISGGSITQ